MVQPFHLFDVAMATYNKYIYCVNMVNAVINIQLIIAHICGLSHCIGYMFEWLACLCTLTVNGECTLIMPVADYVYLHTGARAVAK